MNNQRYIVATFLALATLAGLTLRGLGLPLLASLEVADPQILGVVNASSLVSLLFGAVVFFGLLRNNAAYTFADEAITELRRTTWPDKEETVRSTAVVIGTTLFLAAALASYDFIWAKLTSFFLFTEA
ncbi:MAG: preprotein translocase subunit SecE [Deltaproteobacteria bacterium]|nr:MAG: preprotein translocase subunit SecE [Deltaproteobacteria bacterium]